MVQSSHWLEKYLRLIQFDSWTTHSRLRSPRHPKYVFGKQEAVHHYHTLCKAHGQGKKNKTITLHKGMCYKRFNRIIKKIRFKWLIHDPDIASTKHTHGWQHINLLHYLQFVPIFTDLFHVNAWFNRKPSVKHNPQLIFWAVPVLCSEWWDHSPYLRSASEKYGMQ